MLLTVRNNPMSQKYPEGAIIETHGLRAKIIGRAGEVCFGQIIKGIIQSDAEIFYKSVELLESEGWTVEETPWVPKEGEKFYWLTATTGIEDSLMGNAYQNIVNSGNCYRTRELAQAAAERVRKAFKNE